MEGAELEFLDVRHVIDGKFPGGFKTQDFTKPTSVGHTFINGKSHHPPHVFRGTVLSEGQRLCMLNETEEGFRTSIQKLQDKCTRSDFNKKMLKETITGIEKLNHEAIEQKSHIKTNKGRLTWPTQFKNILRLSKTEKS